jgi:hypothetical protein
MKKKIPAILALGLAALVSLAQGAEPAPSTPSTTSAGAPGEQHARLAQLAGLWNVRQSLWLEAGKPAQVDLGTAMFTMVLGGRQLQQDLRMASSTPFQGIGYMGYDQATRSFVTIWMDVNLTDILLLRGAYDERARVYRFRGEMSGDEGRKIPMREELRIDDATHFVVSYYETREGREALVVELEYSRSSASRTSPSAD